MKNSEKEIVMIGGGLGGLVTGALLSKEGCRVTVLEKNGIIGGGLQCFHRHNTIFETGIHILGGFTEGGSLSKICSYLGILDKLDIRHTDSDCIDSIIFGNGEEHYRLPRGKMAFETYLSGLFPDQAERLHRYMNAMWALSEEVDLFYLREDDGNPLRSHSPEFLMPADMFIAKYISDPVLAELLAYMNPMYAGVAGHTPAFVHALINVLYINGSSMFAGGSQQMADALARVIVNGGGEIRAGDPVTEIAVEERAVTHVVTRSGKKYRGELYISDIHPCTLLELLPETAFIKSYRNRLQEIPNSYSAFSLYIKFKDGAEQPFVNHPCYYQKEHGRIWKLEEYDNSYPNGFMYLTSPAKRQGRWAERMTVNCPMPFSAVEKWAGSRTGNRPADYYVWKEEIKQRILENLEIVSPGINERIEFCLTSSPLTIRDFYGTKEGAIYGYNRDCTNMALSQISIATKVRNLLLTGQNINLHGICGVPLTAIQTAECIAGRGVIVRKINEDYERRKHV